MIQEIILGPLIFVAPFFSSLTSSYPKWRTAVNLVFVSLLSLIYGSFIGIYTTILISVFIGNKYVNIFEVISWFIVFFEIIQVSLVIINRNEEYVFSKIYINILLICYNIIYEKRIQKLLLKYAVLTIILFILFVDGLSKFPIREHLIIPLIIILAFAASVITALIFNRENLNTYKKKVDNFLVKSLLILIPNVFMLIRVTMYNISSIEIIIDVILILFSIKNAFLSLPKECTKIYEYSLLEYSLEISEIHVKLAKKSGFEKIKTILLNEFSIIKQVCSQIKNEYKNGQKKEILVSLIHFFVIISLALIMIFTTYRISDFAQNFIDKSLKIVSIYWVQLFNGNTYLASVILFLIPLVIFLILNIRNLVIDIKMKKKLVEFYFRINRITLLFALMMVFIPIVINSLNKLICFMISGTVILITFICDLIMKIIFGKNYINGL